jgi:hypothetical protein
MSAWVVNREHIDLLVAAGLRGPRRGRGAWGELRWFAVDPGDESWSYEQHVRQLDYSTADEVGRMLWTENVCSVAARYPDDDCSSRPGPVSEDIDLEAIEYVWRNPHYTPTAGEVLKAIACYEYQSCEHDGWRESEARRFCAALESAVCATLYEGPWGWDADEIERARREAGAGSPA